MRTTKKEEPPVSLLKELCGADADLYAVLSRHSYETPLAAIPERNLDILTKEGEESGNFGPAMDKAIFEGAQKPEERERYIEVIQNLASMTMHAMEREKEARAKEGFTDSAASLGSRIEHQRLLSERAGDVLDVASKFYNERLLERQEDENRRARAQQRKTAEHEEQRIEGQEKGARDVRRRERRKMGRAEKREAKRRQKQEDLAAEGRKEAREHQRQAAEEEEKKITEQEETAREARREERSGE